MVKDLRMGPADSAINALQECRGTLLFFANDGKSGNELWRSDGTSQGTLLLKEIVDGVAGTVGGGGKNLGGVYYFTQTERLSRRQQMIAQPLA
jgi:ELWxxDGT repeat protein